MYGRDRSNVMVLSMQWWGGSRFRCVEIDESRARLTRWIVFCQCDTWRLVGGFHEVPSGGSSLFVIWSSIIKSKFSLLFTLAVSLFLQIRKVI